MRTCQTQLSAAVSIAIFEPITDWKIKARAICCVINPETTPKNSGHFWTF